MVGSGDSCWGRAARMGLSKQLLTSGTSHSRAVAGAQPFGDGRKGS